MSRTIGNEISPSRSASCGHGPTEIIWCTAGVRAIFTPAMSPIFGLHTPQAITTYSVSMSPWFVTTFVMRPSLDAEVLHLDVGYDGQRALRQRVLPHDRAGAQRVDDADRRRPEGADDLVGVEERHLLHHELRRDQLGLDAPGLGAGHAPPQLLHPLLGAGHLEAAGLGEDAHLLVLAHRVQREVGDLAGVVDGKDEVRRVPGRAAGVGQRAHVELDDVGPAELGEVVDEAVADDAGSDDDDLGGGGDCGHVGLLSVLRYAQRDA